MNNFHRFQNVRQFSILVSQIWLKKRHTSLFLEFVAKSGQNFIKNSQKKCKIWREKWNNIRNSIFNREKMLAIFGWNVEFEERCKGVHCVDSKQIAIPTSIYLQKSASIQARTSLSKFEVIDSLVFIRLLTHGSCAKRIQCPWAVRTEK